MGVEVGIYSWIKCVYIVLRELLCHTECFCKIGSFIISNGSTGFAGIASDFVIAVNMDKNLIILFYYVAEERSNITSVFSVKRLLEEDFSMWKRRIIKIK